MLIQQIGFDGWQLVIYSLLVAWQQKEALFVHKDLTKGAVSILSLCKW
uniref:Uncharacterized protein n=1 Tax=Rhizophora mucronata TaxID=61149 RepID=A0A2P2IIQ2_RHIMU